MKEETFEIKKYVIFILLTISLLMLSYIYKSTLEIPFETFKVVHVSDGDTIDVEKDNIRYTVRLLGIDTPELHKPDYPIECFANEAKLFLEKLILYKQVKLVKDVEDTDRYDRKLRYVFINEKNINKILVENGFSYLFSNPKNVLYYKELNSALKYAMNSKKGLWKYCLGSDIRVEQNFKENNIDYSFQNGEKTKLITEATEECKIKGNVNSKKERIYHLSDSASYAKIVINLSEGDQIFCSEAEAIKNGFRKAK